MPYCTVIHSVSHFQIKTGAGLGNAEWTMSGNQGNMWQAKQLRLPASKLNQPFLIVFEGVRGASYYGDIAIDDVNVTTGACPSCKPMDSFSD
jgi:hypothetical protein